MSGPSYPPPSFPPPGGSGPPPRTGSRGLVVALVAVGVLVAVVVALAVVLVVVANDDDDDDRAGRSSSSSAEPSDTSTDEISDSPIDETAPVSDSVWDDEHEAVVAAADRFVTTINTYGPADLDAQERLTDYRTAVRSLVTPDFYGELEAAVETAEKSVAGSGDGSSATLLSTGVATLTDGGARVLVAGSRELSGPGGPGATQAFRLNVSLVPDGDAWLVDDFAAVTQATGTDGLDAVGPDEGIPEPAQKARSAAAQAAGVLLGYDYRTLDDDLATARTLLTEDYVGEYDTSFGAVRDQARQLEAVVVTGVAAAGVVQESPDEVTVLLYLDQDSTRGDGDPQRLETSATFTMRLVGGEWLVAEILAS